MPSGPPRQRLELLQLGCLVRRWDSSVLEASVSQLWPSPLASEIYLLLYLLVVFSSLWSVSSKRKRIAYGLCAVYGISRFLAPRPEPGTEGYSANQH